jgi:hypothetical protein
MNQSTHQTNLSIADQSNACDSGPAMVTIQSTISVNNTNPVSALPINLPTLESQDGFLPLSGIQKYRHIGSGFSTFGSGNYVQVCPSGPLKSSSSTLNNQNIILLPFNNYQII